LRFWTGKVNLHGVSGKTPDPADLHPAEERGLLADKGCGYGKKTSNIFRLERKGQAHHIPPWMGLEWLSGLA